MIRLAIRVLPSSPLADRLATGGLAGGAFGQPARHNLIQRLGIHAPR